MHPKEIALDILEHSKEDLTLFHIFLAAASSQ